MRSSRSLLAVPIAMLAAVIAACAGGAPAGSGAASQGAAAGPPQVVIQSPPANAQVVAGVPVDVVMTAVDGVGVARIDLLVNGAAVSSAEAPPGGLASFSAVGAWTPSATGPATLAAVAYRLDGAPSEPMSIAILVLAPGSDPVPYPTFGGAVPTYRAAAVPSNYAPPTYAANPTYGTQPTYVAGATPTAYVAGATPTDDAAATPTDSVGATPTYEVDPTATTDPGMSIAPADANYTLVIPYRGQATVSDYVSYPAGDVEDRVAFSISGIGNTPPQHLARLRIFANCEGLNQGYITFQMGTAKFGCGEYIVNKEVTADSDTGTIRIYAYAGAYVKWTLVGTADQP